MTLGVECWATPLVPALLEVCLSIRRLRQSLKHQEPGKTYGTCKGTLKDGRVNTITIKERAKDLEPTVRVLRESRFVAGAASGQIDRVTLCHEGNNASWSTIDLTAVIGKAAAIDIEASEDLRYALIKAQDDLNVSNRVLGSNRDSVLGADSRCLRKD